MAALKHIRDRAEAHLLHRSIIQPCRARRSMFWSSRIERATLPTNMPCSTVLIRRCASSSRAEAKRVKVPWMPPEGKHSRKGE